MPNNKCFVPIISFYRKDDIHKAELIGVFSSKKKAVISLLNYLIDYSYICLDYLEDLKINELKNYKDGDDEQKNIYYILLVPLCECVEIKNCSKKQKEIILSFVNGDENTLEQILKNDELFNIDKYDISWTT